MILARRRPFTLAHLYDGRVAGPVGPELSARRNVYDRSNCTSRQSIVAMMNDIAWNDIRIGRVEGKCSLFAVWHSCLQLFHACRGCWTMLSARFRAMKRSTHTLAKPAYDEPELPTQDTEGNERRDEITDCLSPQTQ
jgi:hypothetical protein